MKIFNSTTNDEIGFEALGFSGGERHVQLSAKNKELVRDVIIRTSISGSDEIVDLLLAVNALRHQYGQALRILLEIPYMPYARQDRVCAPGQAFSSEVFSELIRSLKPNKVITWDCHSDVALRLTNADNVAPSEIILTDTKLTSLLKDKTTVLVCPDKGAVRRCTNIRRTLGIEQMILCDKERDPKTGKILNTQVNTGDLTGKCAVITDDICDGGFTFLKIAEQLRKKGAKKIVLFATHGIFSKGIDVFDGLVDELITTNSRQQADHPKLRVIEYEHNFNQAVDNGR